MKLSSLLIPLLIAAQSNTMHTPPTGYTSRAVATQHTITDLYTRAYTLTAQVNEERAKNAALFFELEIMRELWRQEDALYQKELANRKNKSQAK